jgi:hypothetical protein
MTVGKGNNHTDLPARETAMPELKLPGFIEAERINFVFCAEQSRRA